ncbi:MAG TPA: metal-dependent hydrolase, partial [Bryobacteraceae bacterium]|nr:metal-dependent hydrolase [Bryobacteraceae bacterium]
MAKHGVSFEAARAGYPGESGVAQRPDRAGPTSMASAITHFIVGAALALPALDSRTIRGVLPRWAILVSCGALAAAPDLDTITMRSFGIPYGSFFGHRGFFHSPFFPVLLAGSLAAIVAGRRSSRSAVWLGLLWAGCAVTHPLLDALTDGGYGVMLLFPFFD